MLSLFEEQEGNQYEWCVTGAEKMWRTVVREIVRGSRSRDTMKVFETTVSTSGCLCKAQQRGYMVGLTF